MILSPKQLDNLPISVVIGILLILLILMIVAGCEAIRPYVATEQCTGASVHSPDGLDGGDLLPTVCYRTTVP